MLTYALVLCCLVLLSYLSTHWYGLTVDLHDSYRRKRITAHLDWMNQPEPSRTKKRRWLR